MDYDDTWFVLCFTACHKTTNNDYRWVNFTGDYLRLLLIIVNICCCCFSFTADNINPSELCVIV